MIAALKPYPTYRDSGLPWLGQVPGHWEILPNRALFNEVKDRGGVGIPCFVFEDGRVSLDPDEVK